MNACPPRLSWMCWLSLLGSCSSPPKPPAVDESHRRPVNAVAMVELQSCRNELHNAGIVSAESARKVDADERALAQARQYRQLLLDTVQAARPEPRNLLVSIPFDFGSATLKMSESQARRIIDAARDAPLVLLRGRTDGRVDVPAESVVARQRAATVQSWLVRSGIDPTHIRATWQPVGDPVANNGTAEGRALNRRVEIEIYRRAPQVATAQGFAAHALRRADGP